MSYILFGLSMVIAIVDWVAVAKNWRKVEYIAKPAVMLALIGWLGQNGGFSGNCLWFVLGLVFSLAGDVFLMLPKEQFIAGLVSFLTSHLMYLGGFLSISPSFNWAGLIVVILVFITASQIFRCIARGIKAQHNESLKIPVLIYTIVISLMLISALFTLLSPNTRWSPAAALSLSAGALLFFLSDTFLAWNRFVAALPYGRVLVMVTYHLGQMLIALGAALQFLS